tara:strand:- start:1692 stop:3329 length:1638 start_codon:yes stop_codon:yes gene_type:complete
MPFGGYPDFNACVMDNKEKKSPEGFCAWLEKKTTGKHSTDLVLGLPSAVAEKFWQTFAGVMDELGDELEAMTAATSSVAGAGWVRQKHGWNRKAEHSIKTREVYGVPIFATGVHNGDAYTAKDINGMVKAFDELGGLIDPPVKVGHTSDEFNVALAKKMGIETEFITGENGLGAMAFGWVDKLRVAGGIMYADLTAVPEPIAEMIESKSFNKVSAEIMFGLKEKGKVFKHVLSGLALLGAELPAVKQTGLETAAIFTYNRQPSAVIEFALGLDDVTYEQLEPALADIDEAIDREFKGRAGVTVIRAMWREVKQKVKTMFDRKQHSFEAKSIEEVDAMNELCLAELGLDEQANDEEIVVAIKKLKDRTDLKAVFSELGLEEDASMADAKKAIGELMSKSDAGDDEVKKFSDRIEEQGNEIRELKRAARVAHFKEIAGELKAISGTPDELAEELVTLEETAGEGTVKKLVERYEDQNRRLIAAGVFKTNGTGAQGDENEEHEFTKNVKTYMEDKYVDEPEAMDALRKKRPDLWRDYMRKRRIVVRAD